MLNQTNFISKYEKYMYKKLAKKYNISNTDYYKLITSRIIYNEKMRVVSFFKEFLIFSDPAEFLNKFYKFPDSLEAIKKYTLYYSLYSKIFPNYILLTERKYIFHNIKKKQKILDEIENKKINDNLNQDFNNNNNNNNNNNEMNPIFSKVILNSIGNSSKSNISFSSSSNLNLNLTDSEIGNINNIICAINKNENENEKLIKENKNNYSNKNTNLIRNEFIKSDFNKKINIKKKTSILTKKQFKKLSKTDIISGELKLNNQNKYLAYQNIQLKKHLNKHLNKNKGNEKWSLQLNNIEKDTKLKDFKILFKASTNNTTNTNKTQSQPSLSYTNLQSKTFKNKNKNANKNEKQIAKSMPKLPLNLIRIKPKTKFSNKPLSHHKQLLSCSNIICLSSNAFQQNKKIINKNITNRRGSGNYLEKNIKLKIMPSLQISLGSILNKGNKGNKYLIKSKSKSKSTKKKNSKKKNSLNTNIVLNNININLKLNKEICMNTNNVFNNNNDEYLQTERVDYNVKTGKAIKEESLSQSKNKELKKSKNSFKVSSYRRYDSNKISENLKTQKNTKNIIKYTNSFCSLDTKNIKINLKNDKKKKLAINPRFQSLSNIYNNNTSSYSTLLNAKRNSFSLKQMKNSLSITEVSSGIKQSPQSNRDSLYKIKNKLKNNVLYDKKNMNESKYICIPVSHRINKSKKNNNIKKKKLIYQTASSYHMLITNNLNEKFQKTSSTTKNLISNLKI